MPVIKVPEGTKFVRVVGDKAIAYSDVGAADAEILDFQLKELEAEFLYTREFPGSRILSIVSDRARLAKIQKMVGKIKCVRFD